MIHHQLMMCQQHLRINFAHMDVEGAMGTCYDSVAIYDGSSPAASLITTLCGTEIPQDIVSSGNSILVVFSSDASVTQGGFWIEYITEPEDVPTGSLNRIASITQRHNACHCKYSIHHQTYTTNPYMTL